MHARTRTPRRVHIDGSFRPDCSHFLRSAACYRSSVPLLCCGQASCLRSGINVSMTTGLVIAGPVLTASEHVDHIHAGNTAKNPCLQCRQGRCRGPFDQCGGLHPSPPQLCRHRPRVGHGGHRRAPSCVCCAEIDCIGLRLGDACAPLSALAGTRARAIVDVLATQLQMGPQPAAAGVACELCSAPQPSTGVAMSADCMASRSGLSSQSFSERAGWALWACMATMSVLGLPFIANRFFQLFYRCVHTAGKFFMLHAAAPRSRLTL